MTRRKRSATAFLAVAALIALYAAPASAVTLLVDGTVPSVRWQRYVDQRMFVPTVSGPIRLFLGNCPSPIVPREMGCEGDATIWDAGRDAVDAGDILRHELGHAFDRADLTYQDREAFRRIWAPMHGTPSGAWWGTLADYAATTRALIGYLDIPAERFAASYAVCSEWPNPSDVVGVYYSSMRAPGWSANGLTERLQWAG